METMKNNCTGMDEKLADLLLDPAAVPAKVQTHVAECERCRRELAELKATMALLDEWKAPEPSPYFLTRLDARMREEREAAPAGWLAARWRGCARGLLTGPVRHARPLAAMALTVLLFVGGGTYLGVTDWNQPASRQRRRPWFMTCRCWTAMRRYWISWSPSPITMGEIRRGLARYTFSADGRLGPMERFVNWVHNARTMRRVALAAAGLLFCVSAGWACGQQRQNAPRPAPRMAQPQARQHISRSIDRRRRGRADRSILRLRPRDNTASRCRRGNIGRRLLKGNSGSSIRRAIPPAVSGAVWADAAISEQDGSASAGTDTRGRWAAAAGRLSGNGRAACVSGRFVWAAGI